MIAGQKPIVTKAKNSIAGFKLREGQAIGCKVTLRGDRMWEFLDRLMSVAIPRIRDFRGLPAQSWDGRGNYTFGLNDQTVFPEIDYDKIDTPRGMDITIVTTADDQRAGQGAARCVRLPVQAGRRRRRRPAAQAEASAAVARQVRRARRSDERQRDMAKKVTDQQGNCQAEVQGARLHPLPPLRPRPFRVPQVRPLPRVPARAGPRRRDPRPDEVELVRRNDDAD